MIKIENVVLPSAEQWEAIIRGMRNPMNSWDKSDSIHCDVAETGDCPLLCDWIPGEKCPEPVHCDNGECGFCIGQNDFALMEKLVKAGSAHAKYKRMICVYCDITAPMYWWKEWDTYLHTVRNSCSTMHKIDSKEITLDDFSHEHLFINVELGKLKPIEVLKSTVVCLNQLRDCYNETKNKDYWYAMIQLLPSSYNQRATVIMNYETLSAMYKWRKNHKLAEWKEFCKWIENLPYSELITGGVENELS